VSSGYRFHPGTRLALLQGAGPFSLDEWELAARDVLTQASWRGTRRILSDRRRMAGRFPPTIEERALAFFREHAQDLGDVQWAVVVSSDSTAFDTVRLAAELSKSTRVRVQGFTDIAVALQWILGVSPEGEIAALIQWIEATPDP
jgi:hypothetical protein